ncbi:GNAT family N-acetyltransferase [Hungatella hathewayi]|uniref:GNAT family N-acetyltransferase n=1 Tax=Hungatella hathewayi TaxID=154046 RepID=UPI003563D1BC
MYIALIKDRCAGFFYYIPKGCFHSFPYLHLIAVKEEYRGQGIGRKLIDYLENVVCADAHSALRKFGCRFQSGSEAFLRKKWLSAGGRDSRPLQRGNNGIHHDEGKLSEARPDKDLLIIYANL